jgi:hypothetical protein
MQLVQVLKGLGTTGGFIGKEGETHKSSKLDQVLKSTVWLHTRSVLKSLELTLKHPIGLKIIMLGPTVGPLVSLLSQFSKPKGKIVWLHAPPFHFWANSQYGEVSSNGLSPCLPISLLSGFSKQKGVVSLLWVRVKERQGLLAWPALSLLGLVLRTQHLGSHHPFCTTPCCRVPPGHQKWMHHKRMILQSSLLSPALGITLVGLLGWLH